MADVQSTPAAAPSEAKMKRKHAQKRKSGVLSNSTNGNHDDTTHVTKKARRDQKHTRSALCTQSLERRIMALQARQQYLQARRKEALLRLKEQKHTIADEFERLKAVGADNTTELAKQPANALKNRYQNVLPPDHSIVKLKVNKEFDAMAGYINANFIEAHMQPRGYIATQGPLEATVGTFWRMIWEQQVEFIVMLANTVESGRHKCHRYWPEREDGSKLKLSGFSVKLTRVAVYDTYIVRAFQIRHKRKSRIVTQFQFREWRDKDVPVHAQLLDFIQTVRQQRSSHSAAPLVVHCSAGIGRTGTFIAIDQLLERIERSDPCLDVRAIVQIMRTRRTGMVQTSKQYKFIHTFLAETLKAMLRDLDSELAVVKHALEGPTNDENAL
eukprot:m.95675 g.95675  ORF g.95675 m.95675 type:complete len:385 (+) comp8758_c0_seq4:17-1171(+)